jgi:hypothetical protein
MYKMSGVGERSFRSLLKEMIDTDEDFAPVELSDGSSLVVDLNSGNEIIFQLHRRDGTVEQIHLTYPSAGLGGGRIIVSP